jgi:hypothetical protein
MGLFKQQLQWYGADKLCKYFPNVDDRINDRAGYARWLEAVRNAEDKQ